MSLTLRIVLIVCCILSFLFVMRRIRKSQIQISDAVFWILGSLLLVILSIFPQIVEWFSGVLGIASPVNCIFLIIIFLLLVRVFGLTIKVSQLENKVMNFAQRYAIDQNLENKNEETKK